MWVWLTGAMGPTGAGGVVGGGVVVAAGATVGLICKADMVGFGAVPRWVIKRPALGLLVLLPYRT